MLKSRLKCYMWTIFVISTGISIQILVLHLVYIAPGYQWNIYKKQNALSMTAPPNITSVRVLNSTSFTVNWEATGLDDNYILVTWTNLHTGMKEGNVTVSNIINSHTVTGLSGIDNYNVSIAVNNSYGMMMSDPITVYGTTQMDAGNLPVIRINQSMEISIVDALTMSLTCTATVGKNNLACYDMRWSGMNLENSLWIQQSHVKKEGDYIEKKLFFKPWLDSLAGEYTCHLFVKNHPHATAYNRSHVIGGNFCGLINSRNTSQKFENTLPSKWFPNANLCGGDNVWNEYADFHKSVLSGKEKQRYLKYSCTHRICGGYGNRIGGIAVLLIYAMFTKRALLLDMTVPVDINLYLLPNGVEWNHIVPKGLTTRDFNLIDSKKFLHHVKTFENAVLSDQYDIVNVQINFGLFYFVPKMNDSLVHYMIKMLNLRTHYDLVLLYGCAFHYLFKYQPKTIKAIDALQYKLGLETGKYVAMHVRSRIGDTYHPLNLKYERMFECAAEAAKAMSHKLNVPKVPIFLAADHPQVTQYAIEHYKDSIVLSKAPLFHIDLTKYTGGNATNQYDSGMIGLFSDIEICSRAGVVIRSAFSTMSEVIGAINFPSPKRHLHPFYFYNDLSACQQ